MKSCAVLHIPHSSTAIPTDIRAAISLSNAALDNELLVMTDWFTDEIFSSEKLEIPATTFPVSRLVVDPERFVLDADEPMAKVGMGVIYNKTSHGEILRSPPSRGELDVPSHRGHRSCVGDDPWRPVAVFPGNGHPGRLYRLTLAKTLFTLNFMETKPLKLTELSHGAG